MRLNVLKLYTSFIVLLATQAVLANFYPFRRPLCPCKCDTTLSRLKGCAGLPASCVIVRCTPRKFGFACCEKKAIPSVPPSPRPSFASGSLEEARQSLNVFVQNLRNAVKFDRERSEDLLGALDRCEMRLNNFRRESNVPEVALPGESHALYRQTAVWKLVRQKIKLPSNAFTLFAMATTATLRYLVTELRRILRS